LRILAAESALGTHAFVAPDPRAKQPRRCGAPVPARREGADMSPKRLRIALALAGVLATVPTASGTGSKPAFDPLLADGARCGPTKGGSPALLKQLLLAATETSPFQPPPARPALAETPVLYGNLGKLSFKAGTRNAKAQAWFDQGVRLAFGFNHAEAQRAFREAQKLDPSCALCYWGEALVLGPNINAPMAPEANKSALAALAKAVEFAPAAPERDRALIEALAARYSADPKAERAALDAAYAGAMKQVAARFPVDDTVQALYAEALMDSQPWDYWEAGGTKPKGQGAVIVATLETVLERNPNHAGAIHLYIHAVEASTTPERALPYANKLGALMPGAGHIVHMPAHVYYRVGMYRESLETNKRAMAADERYFKTSPSDPLYMAGYYPHNIHFLMVSAQMGGDGKAAIDAAQKLDASMAAEVVAQFPIMQPVKAAPYTTHAQFSAPEAILALPAPPAGLALVETMYHYARAVAFAQKKDAGAAQKEIDALARLEKDTDYKPFEEWAIPAKEIIQTARLVASGRLADAGGDLNAAARAYEEAIFIEDSLAYMEPPYWYYPVRQSLGAVRLRQGNLDEAEKAFRDSLARVRNNGWALAGLAETYKRKGDAVAEKAARQAYAKTWFGAAPGPPLERL
jgi:tetratricopeptide (TPR) repeat protein